MQRFRPLIGMTPGYRYGEDKSYIKDGYYEGISKAGGLPVLLPLTEDEDLMDDYIRRCDGFLLPGGPDVDAQWYGEQNLAVNGEICPGRDVMEISIARKAFKARKSLLGICRGIQVMNVAFGGTLYQDIHAQLKDMEMIRHSQAAPVWYPTHEVLFEKDSKVAEYLVGNSRVNSFHHQSVKDLAENFIISSRAPDGIIESIEYKGNNFAVGVQWHPEVMWQKTAGHLQLFEMLISACRGEG